MKKFIVALLLAAMTMLRSLDAVREETLGKAVPRRRQGLTAQKRRTPAQQIQVRQHPEKYRIFL